VEVPKHVMAQIVALLNTYKLRAKVNIAPVKYEVSGGISKFIFI
jgi:hypothetical protein